MTNQATRLLPFVPSGPDFARALDFFHAIGFETAWKNEGLAGVHLGAAEFILQDIHVPEWQRNQMIVLEVPDLDAYWRGIEAKNLAATFPGVRLRPPTEFAWGREAHLVDPAGVCWHVRAATG